MIPRAEDISQDNKTKDDELIFEYEHIKHVYWYDRILLNRPLKVLIAVLLSAVVAPLLIYQFWFYPSVDSPPSDGYSTGSCLLPRAARLACGTGNMNEFNCHPQCCYDQQNHFCFHRLPSRFSYIMDRQWSENVTLQPRVSTVPYSFQNSVPSLKISIDEITPTHLSINFYNTQFIKQPEGRRIANKVYNYVISSPEMNVVVNSPQGNIFNTLRGPLIASQNIWEISFKTTNESMYGFGEIPLKQGTVKIIYNSDRGDSSIPLIFSKINGSYHGLLIDSSAPTEVTILNENQIVVRSITSFGVKFHLFTGPKPEHITKEVMDYIGSVKGFEYWMLGAHVCSELAESPEDAIMDLNDFISKSETQRIPYESHCGALPVAFKSDTCDLDEIDAINTGVQLIKRANRRFVPHVSPYIQLKKPDESEEEGQTDERTEANCSSIMLRFERYMLRDSNSLQPYEGLVHGNKVLYLDYATLPDELVKRLWLYNTEVDGIVLENNWPLDESQKAHNETSFYLPYFNENFKAVFERTPKWNISLPNDGGKHIFKHNLYGNAFIGALQKMFDKEIPTWSTSQWMNGNVAINRQNVDTSWTTLHKELISMSLGGISGHVFWSSPICGDTADFDLDKHADLCVKWYMAGTFFPLLKIHSKTTPRDPTQFVGTQRVYINTALNNRLSLSPYFYTVLQDGPLLRPMFYQYPTESKLKDVNTQFNVGNDLLIVPNLQPSQTHVHISIPPGTWYELWGGLKLNASVGEVITMTTIAADFLILIRGGSILPLQKLHVAMAQIVAWYMTLNSTLSNTMQDVRVTAEQTRLNSKFTLIIALECANSTDNNIECNAAGHLYMSNNMTINIQANDEELHITAAGDGYEIFCDQQVTLWANEIGEINIYGLDEEFNNYDNHKQISTSIDLCELKERNEINFKFI